MRMPSSCKRIKCTTMLDNTIINSPDLCNGQVIHTPITSCDFVTIHEKKDEGDDETIIVGTRKKGKKIKENNTGIVQNRSAPSVGFNHVSLREYAVIIGDNPACSFGAPLR